jgi:hypothetical protein
MKKIKLVNQERYVLVDDADFDFLNQFQWYLSVGRYAVTFVNGHIEKMHRLLLKSPENITIDHIDRNGLNNQRSNLRLATQTQNNANSRKRGGCSSKYKGVYRNNKLGCWAVQITYKGKWHHLGVFSSEEEAARQYNKKARKLFGEYAKLNIIEDYRVPICPMGI